MRVNLLTDAPVHNLALMKVSAYHKARGDIVTLNEPQEPATLTYGSWLFKQLYYADIQGGPGYKPEVRLDPDIDSYEPDYSLYPRLEYSLGYTWRYCPGKCEFCVVPKQDNPRVHRSIWSFHRSRFKKICLLNNNTFTDPSWRYTFEEIWDAGLTVVEHGFDVRLLDEEKAEALKRTRFDKGYVHFAWDFMADEKLVVRGLKIAQDHKIAAMVYVLIGFNTTREEDLHRCQVINLLGFDPYPMPYNGGTKADRTFKRFICLRGYRRYRSLRQAWISYCRPIPRRALKVQREVDEKERLV